MGRQLRVVAWASALVLLAACGPLRSGGAQARARSAFSPSQVTVAGFAVRLMPQANRWQVRLRYRGPARTVSWTASWLTVSAVSRGGGHWSGHRGPWPQFVILKPLKPGQQFSATYADPPPGHWTLTVRVLGQVSPPIQWVVPARS